MHRKIIFCLSVILLAFILDACDPQVFVPVFPRQPVISFKGIKPEPLPTKDSLIITISFRDGDGDLGLGPFDTLPPFNADNIVDGRREPNPLRNNYHVTAFKRRGRNAQGEPQYVPVEFPSPDFTFNGRFPVLKPDGQPGPIEGDLQYSIPIEFPQSLTNENYILPGDTLRFEVFIYDRDDRGAERDRVRNPNMSNIITTTDVVVLQER